MKLPAKLDGLFKPCRYKVMYGGRGGGKSHGAASALLALGAQRPLRILCVREIQKSMRDSVHRLLKDKVAQLGLGHFYEITDFEIRGANGTLFVFSACSRIPWTASNRLKVSTSYGLRKGTASVKKLGRAHADHTQRRFGNLDYPQSRYGDGRNLPAFYRYAVRRHLVVRNQLARQSVVSRSIEPGAAQSTAFDE